MAGGPGGARRSESLQEPSVWERPKSVINFLVRISVRLSHSHGVFADWAKAGVEGPEASSDTLGHLGALVVPEVWVLGPSPAEAPP